MITVNLNGETKELASGTSLNEALDQWQLLSTPFAVAINETFVPKTQYDSVSLNEGDRLDIVSPIQGG